MMLRSALVLFAALLLALHACPVLAGGGVGFYGGLNSGGLSGDTPPHTSYSGRSGLVAGISGEIAIGDDILLGLHPCYIRKGTTISQLPPTEDSDPVENDLRLDYISLPLLVKFESGNGVTYFSGGFDLAFLMDARLSALEPDLDVNELLNDVDLSMDFAFGGKIPLGKPDLTLELRYSQSILNLADIQVGEDGRSVPARFRSNGFQFLTGLNFPLGGR